MFSLVKIQAFRRKAATVLEWREYSILSCFLLLFLLLGAEKEDL
jgi:hypothetical protein